MNAGWRVLIERCLLCTETGLSRHTTDELTAVAATNYRPCKTFVDG